MEKIAATGMTPMAQGTGDRPYPGAFLTHKFLLKQLGTDDHEALLKGEGVPWTDPRVRAALEHAKEIIDEGAFAAPDEGGQPDDFALGIVNGRIPEDAACPTCKTIAVSGLFVVNAATEQPDLTAKFLNSMATAERGNAWLEANLVGTGIKADPSTITGDNAEYFTNLAAANKGAA